MCCFDRKVSLEGRKVTFDQFGNIFLSFPGQAIIANDCEAYCFAAEKSYVSATTCPVKIRKPDKAS